MKRNWLLALVATAIAIAAPARAETLPDLKALSDDQLIALYEKMRSAKSVDNCNGLVPILSEMLLRPNLKGPIKGIKALADIDCAVERRDWKAAYRLLPEVEAHIGEDTGPFGFLVALFAGHPDIAAERMTGMAAAPDGTKLLSIKDDQTYHMFRELALGKHYQQRRLVALTMLDSQHYSELSPDMQSALAGFVIDEEARSGKFERSAKLLGRVNNPHRFISFLAMKEFEPIWPQIEQAVGANMAPVIERTLGEDQARFKADPKDREAFQQVAHSLLFAGRFEEVARHLASFDHSEAGIAKATEHDAWALNIEAYALDVLGRSAEAEAIFEKIAAIPYEPKSNGWLVNFAINRGSRLVEMGQWGKGLAAANYAGQVAGKSGSPYARMLVRRDKVCALQNLGRGAETASLVEEVIQNRKDSYTAAATALLCAGQVDQAAQAVIEALSDNDHGETMASDLQKAEFELFYTKSKLPRLRETLLTRPDVRAAYDKVARDIPDSFIPLGGKRRSELLSKRP